MAYGGHSFGKKTFHKPTYCHHCSDLLWGLIGQGYICEVCNFIVHEKCVTNVVTPCQGIAPCLIKNPVAHCFSEPTHHKRRFCTVCRKRLDETPAVHCLICEYYAHVECQDFAIADCKENATYVPGKELGHVKHGHHWREGNLPQSSKCAHCKKTCWSSECLTGYRCEWCGFTTHGGCRVYVPMECTFGMCQPIYLPPHAVSIPRTEVPMEAIIGVQVRNKGTPLQRDYSCPELRTIGMCDATESDLLIQNYNERHRKLSDYLPPPSPAISIGNYSSGAESQSRSHSNRSLYDNVDENSEIELRRRYMDRRQKKSMLMPPKPPPRASRGNLEVNRSKSFQEPAQNRTYLSPYHYAPISRNRFHVSSKNSIGDTNDSLSNRSTVSAASISSQSVNNEQISLISHVPIFIHQPTTILQQETIDYTNNQPLHDPSQCISCKGTKVHSGHILGRIYRRVRKISLGWRKKTRCKKNRGENILPEQTKNSVK